MLFEAAGTPVPTGVKTPPDTEVVVETGQFNLTVDLRSLTADSTVALAAADTVDTTGGIGGGTLPEVEEVAWPLLFGLGYLAASLLKVVVLPCKLGKAMASLGLIPPGIPTLA